MNYYTRLSSTLILAMLATSTWGAKICIDPGHGGSDSGAIGGGQTEKANVLATGLKFRDWLNRDTNDTGGGGSWSVIMTRTTDVFVELSGRTSFANNNAADRFMSIHNNACGCGASGTETFSYTSGSSTSHNLRNHVQQRMVQAWGLTNRGNKTANFYVIRYTSMPSELAELGFIDNANDRNFLGNASHQDNMAKHHLFAIQSHYGLAAYTPSAGGSSNPPYFFTSNVEGWGQPSNCTSPWHAAGSWPGCMVTDQTGNDAHVRSPQTNFVGSNIDHVNVRVYPQSGTSDQHDMQVFWTTAASGGESASKSSPIVNYTAASTWRVINLPVNHHADWAGQTITRLRLDFDNTSKGNRWIVDYVRLGKQKWWTFENDVMGWTAGNGVATPWHAGGSWPGCMVVDQTGNDAFVYSPTVSGFGGFNDVVNVRLYIQAAGSSSHQMQVYFRTTGEDFYSEDKSLKVNYTLANSTWGIVQIPIGTKPKWEGAEYKGIRLDFDDVKSGTPRYIVDYVIVRQ